MNAKSYGIAAAVLGIVAAYWLGKSGAAKPESAPSTAPASLQTTQSSEELTHLRTEVVALRAQLAEHRRASPSVHPSAAHPGEGPAQPSSSPSGQDEHGALSRLFSLLDAGEAGRSDLMAFMASPDMEVFLADAQDDPSILRGFFESLTPERSRRASALIDAILSRAGEPDAATANALSLFLEFDIRSGLPRERQLALLTDLLARMPQDGLGAQLRDQAGDALARLKAVEALPAIEKLLTTARANNSWRLIETIRDMGGPEALASLKRIAASGDPETVRWVENALRDMKGDEANAFLWDRIGNEKDPSRRVELWQAVAGRPENAERVTKLIADPATAPAERGAMIQGLLDGGATKAVWALYENGAGDLRSQALTSLAGRGDPKAMDLIIQGLGSGQTSPTMAGYVGWADPGTLARNQDSLRAALGNTATPVSVRGQIASALARVDRPGAVQALTSGFQGMAEADRVAVIQILGRRLNGPEAQAFLSQVAGSDPAEAVRDSARSFVAP